MLRHVQCKLLCLHLGNIYQRGTPQRLRIPKYKVRFLLTVGKCDAAAARLVPLFDGNFVLSTTQVV